MKALFIRCNGKLTPDMLVGGLIDMGVPPAYLRTKLEAAGVSSDFIESSNLDAKVSAHYFCIPEKEDKPLFAKAERSVCHMEENLRRWRVGMGKLGVESVFSSFCRRVRCIG